MIFTAYTYHYKNVSVSFAEQIITFQIKSSVNDIKLSLGNYTHNALLFQFKHKRNKFWTI